MAGLDPAIHVWSQRKTWMPGTRPGMTEKRASTEKHRMPNESTLSREELDDRIAILRDNLRQLNEQAAALSGAANEERAADRIADQQAELDRLIAQREALGKK
jgi:uncharacterized small protein (DUF1192 family)